EGVGRVQAEGQAVAQGGQEAAEEVADVQVRGELGTVAIGVGAVRVGRGHGGGGRQVALTRRDGGEARPIEGGIAATVGLYVDEAEHRLTLGVGGVAGGRVGEELDAEGGVGHTVQAATDRRAGGGAADPVKHRGRLVVVGAVKLDPQLGVRGDGVAKDGDARDSTGVVVEAHTVAAIAGDEVGGPVCCATHRVTRSSNLDPVAGVVEDGVAEDSV